MRVAKTDEDNKLGAEKGQDKMKEPPCLRIKAYSYEIKIHTRGRRNCKKTRTTAISKDREDGQDHGKKNTEETQVAGISQS
jgi:hypothetical protein